MEKNKTTEDIKKELLKERKSVEINEISNSFPFPPRYLGPGTWIKVMKELYGNNKNREK